MTFGVRVRRLIGQIPRGRVATYGQIAALAGRPRSARAVGAVLREVGAGLPWHRVVNAAGRISPRAQTASVVTQRIRLEQEGVAFRGGRVDLRRFRWEKGGRAACGFR